MSLRARFGFIFTALVVFVVALTGVFFFSSRAHLDRKIGEEQQGALRKFAGLCQEAALTQNEIILVSSDSKRDMSCL